MPKQHILTKTEQLCIADAELGYAIREVLRRGSRSEADNLAITRVAKRMARHLDQERIELVKTYTGIDLKRPVPKLKPNSPKP